MKKPKTSPEKLPDVKYDKIGESEIDVVKIKDKKGKTHKVKHEQFAEREIDSVNLVKIAPMFYFCTDNNKILLIPFSIQFSPTEILKLCATLAANIQSLLSVPETPEPKNQKDQIKN